MWLTDVIIEGDERQEEPNKSIYFKNISLEREFFCKRKWRTSIFAILCRYRLLES